MSRQTTLYECWKKLTINFYLGENLVSTQTFSFSEAHKKRLQFAALELVLADKVVLNFSDPVTIDLKGEFVNPNTLGSGYTEILFEKTE